jgi:multiple sugar transport system substrate-binding protein
MILCAIFVIITASALLLIFKPFSNSTSMAVPAADEGQSEAGVDDRENITDAETADSSSPVSDEKRKINIYLNEGRYHLHNVISTYAQRYWKFPYELNFVDDGLYYSSPDIISLINDSLTSGDGAVDIYVISGMYAQHYVKGDYARYACTYKELGIDVDTAVKNADIPTCVLEAGRNPDGEIIALPYLAETSVFLYRRSIAKDVWGTDNPEIIGDMIGGGTQKWDKFTDAARTLKEHGYYISPGFEDISDMIDTSLPPAAQDPTMQYDIDPVWEEFMDLSKQMVDNGFISDTRQWTEQWNDLLNNNRAFGIVTLCDAFEYTGLDGTSGDWAICLPPFSTRNDYPGIFVSKDSHNKDILGPLVEWMTLDCSEEGLQYGLSAGTLSDGTKMSVVSGTVLKNTDGSREYLGGQDINPLIYKALRQPMGKRCGLLAFNDWLDAVDSYIKGEKSKIGAIEDFKYKVRTEKRFFTKYALPDPKAASDHTHEKPIVWTDKNIESAVRKVLFKPDEDIYPSDALRVTGLDLADMDIENPEDLRHLKNLSSLYLESNKISDISCLKELTKLESLDISINNIADISVLGELRNLKALYMNSNKISDISSLVGLSGLETLDVRNNLITDLSSLEGKQNLKVLDASRNNISDIKSIGGLTSLESLDLSDNKINDLRPLKKLLALRELNLSYNDINDINSLRTLKKLEVLSLNGNKISDISSLKGLKSLRELVLTGIDIADRSPADHVESVEW